MAASPRNPVASLPEVAQAIAQLSPEARAGLRACLNAMAKDWRVRAEHSWHTRKPPMAAYWRAQAVNARHLALALRTK